MKKLIILILLMLPFAVKAQRQTEYNQKGDEARARKDYQEAIFWYEQGVLDCNRYSIRQLTEIYKADESMHAAMRIVMSNSLRCLTEQAQANDTTAIKQLIDFYIEGIGTVKNEDNATFWQGQLDRLRRPPITEPPIPREPKDRMKFFAGYHASLIAPFGIQVGGMGKSIGWYVRFRSNLTFQPTEYNAEIDKNHQWWKIAEFDHNVFYKEVADNRKKTYLMGSAGIMIKTVTNLYISAGAGYWDHKYSREFVKVNDNETVIQGPSIWARDNTNSKNGITIDLDGTYIISGKFYGTLGVTLLDLKYVYPNAGVGIFF